MTEILLRTSERNDFKRCPWKWQETWVKGLTTKRTPTWAWFGTAIHAGLEAWYKPGKKRGTVEEMLEAFNESLDGAVRRIYTEGGELEDDEVVDGKVLGEHMLRGYVKEYGQDVDWEVIHTEQTFQIDVEHPYKDGKVIRVYAGTWDVLMRHRGTKEFWLWDHKTRKTFPGNWQFYGINDQAGSYLWVAPEVLRHLGVFKKKDQIEGLVFNALRKHLPDSRPLDHEGFATNKPLKAHYLAALESAGLPVPDKATVAALEAAASAAGLVVLGERSAVQPAPLYHREQVFRTQYERVKQGHRVQQEALWMDDILKGKREAFKTPQEDCTRCQIFEYCEADEQNYDEGQELARAVLRHRDPYRDHREAMEKGGVSL